LARLQGLDRQITVNSLFRPEIIRDLELKRHGFAMCAPQPVELHAISRRSVSPDGSRQRR
jgi:hypothetical protein